jgi:hypothetical protein
VILDADSALDIVIDVGRLVAPDTDAPQHGVDRRHHSQHCRIGCVTPGQATLNRP